MSLSSSCKDASSNDTTSSFAFDANSPSTFTHKVSLTNFLTSAGILKLSNLSAKLVFVYETRHHRYICWPDVRNVGKWSIFPGHRSAEKSVSFFWNAWSFSSCVTVWSLLVTELIRVIKTSLRKQTAAERKEVVSFYFEKKRVAASV